MTPGIAAVVPVRNDAADLPTTVDSILAQPEVTEILLCVGPSDDGTVELAATLAANHDKIRVVENPSGRTPSALNAGLAEVTQPLLMRVDARSVLPERYVAMALETLKDTGAGNVGAVQFPTGVTPTSRAIAHAMRHRLGNGGAAYRVGGARQPVDTAYLGFFRTAALRQVGGWDDEFIRNQDAELNTRLNEVGQRVWLDPRLIVEYRPRPSLSALARQYWQYGWWRQRTIQKHPGSKSTRQLIPPAMIITLILSLILAVIVSPWFLLIPLGYAAVVVAAGLSTAGPIGQRFTSAAALATMHLSWGTSFLVSWLSSMLGRNP